MQVKFGKENITINKLILRETFKTANEYIRENQIMNENLDELTWAKIPKNVKMLSKLDIKKEIRVKIHNIKIAAKLF